MHLTRIRLGGVPPFTEPIELKFDEHVNVFTGANATGKSKLLAAIDDRFNESSAGRQWPITSEQLHLRLNVCEESDYREDWTEGKNLVFVDPDFADTHYGSRANLPPPVIYIGPTRIGLPRVSELGDSDSVESTVEEALSRPFSGASLKTVIDLLYDKTRRMYEYERLEEPPTDERRAWNFLYVDEVAYSCAKSICRELITSGRALNYPTGLDVEYIADQPLADLEGISINRMLGITTIDTPKFSHLRPEEQPIGLPEAGSKRIYTGDLSSGSQSVLLWILWLALKMLNYYEFANDWAKRPAILLIDEIENHLHPTWQRRVIPALLEHFPGLQIFATTHSPFVVAGLKAGQVHLLQRDAEGVVTASTNERDVISWTADEILRTLMGVDEPTDQLTVNRANRLRELRRKQSRTPEEETELQELRRQVNRDLLSKVGPLEAEQERFDDWIQNFLRSRQSDLTQDGE